MIRGGCIWVTSGCNWEPSGQSRCERPKEDWDGARLIRVKNKSSDITMSFAFNAAYSFRRGDAGNNDVSLLFKFDDKRETQRMITTQHDNNLPFLGSDSSRPNSSLMGVRDTEGSVASK
jgi:hypothetical protein